MVSRLIGGLIAIVIGLALLPVVIDFVDGLTATGEALHETTAGTLVDLLPILFVIAIVVGVISYMKFGGGGKN